MRCITGALLCALVVTAASGCTGIFDTRPPCAEVTVNKNSVKTELDKDGIARKSYEVTIRYNKQFGRAFAIVPDYKTSQDLKDSSTVTLRLEANGYTLHGKKYGDKCNPEFRVG